MSKESDQLQQELSKIGSQGSISQALVPIDQQRANKRVSQVRKQHAKLPIGKKKPINEDLALVASNKKGLYYMDSSRDDQEYPGQAKEQLSIEEESHGNDDNNMQLALIPSKQEPIVIKRVPKNFNRLEALKFKMQLQLKNIRLLKDHDLLMRGIEKK